MATAVIEKPGSASVVVFVAIAGPQERINDITYTAWQPDSKEQINKDKRKQRYPVSHAECHEPEKRRPSTQQDMPHMRQLGIRLEVTDSDPDKGRCIDDYPLGHTNERHRIGLNKGKVERHRNAHSSAADIRNDGITKGSDTDGACIANDDYQPAPAAGLFTIKRRSHQSTKDDVERMKSEEKRHRNIRRGICVVDNNHHDNADNGTASRKRNMR